MYSVYGDGICIYNDFHLTKSSNALTPKFKISDNTAGSLEITLPVGNAGYESLSILKSEIVIKRYNEDIWAGRIISEENNFQNSRILICEGELAYLNDTTQPPNEYTNVIVYDFISSLITEHNSKVDSDKQFEIGAITVHENISRITDNESTLEAINDHLISKLGGHIRIRRVYDEDGILHKYFDYLEDYPNTNAQEIRFGRNLLDFTKKWDMSNFATVIMPKGTRLNSSVDTYLDVSSVNGESRYVANEEAIKEYGWIEKVIEWEDITNPSELLEKAHEYLSTEQFNDVEIEISAVDLQYLSRDVKPIDLLDMVRCVSRPHGMDKLFPVSELSIQLDKPENSIYKLGGKIKQSFEINRVTDVIEKASKLPTERNMLNKAKKNATSLINMATQGFVTIIKNKTGSESLVVSKDKTYDPSTDLWSKTTSLWRWNVNGLGYSNDGGRTYGLAITMDGSIVADYITSGILSTVLIKSLDGNVAWNLNNEDVLDDTGKVIYPAGSLAIKKGEIMLGISSENPNGLFSVDNNGYLNAEYGKIGGFTLSSYSIYNDVIELNNNGLNFFESGNLLGKYGTGKWKLQPSLKGLTVNMETNTSYMAWSYRESNSADSYTIKLMYTADQLISDDGDYFSADRLHLGTYMQLDRYGFEYMHGNKAYKSTTLIKSSSNETPRKISLAFNLEQNGSNLSWDYVDCYICNGVIMI